MRIAVTSDLHCDVTPQNRKIIPYLVEQVRRLAPDSLVLAGDLANTLAGWGETLRHFRALDVLKLVVPGNHDVWIESKSALGRAQDSAWKHDVALPAIAAEQGFHYLPGRPLIVGAVGFAGSLGWYDYSLQDPRLDGVIRCRQYEEGTFIDSGGYSRVWNDTRRAAWLRYPHSENWRQRRLRLSTVEVCSKLTGTLEAESRSIIGRVRKLVVVIHTNPFRSCLVRGIKPDPFDAYEGSIHFGELVVRLGRQREVLCICGHRHRPLDMTESGVRLVRSPVGYLDDFDGDYKEQAAKVVRVIEF